jgi:DNA polymerase-3 subunit epsilon
LERDGVPALDAYRDFAAYAEGVPLVAFNLQYDLDEVLHPEWERLGISPIGVPGFCALRLAQRLLDPVPAGNCKLQTLRQFYRLPERGAHTALGDVETVADLLQQVLRPIAEANGLHEWQQIVEYAAAEWFPSRIAFGKFKGRFFQEASTDPALKGWLEWLATSKNPQTADLGKWYLDQLARQSQRPDPQAGTILVAFLNPAVVELKRLIAAARLQLAEIESRFTAERHAVDVTQASLFGLLRNQYQRRDRLTRVVEYRRKFLSTLIREGEEAAEEIVEQFKDASQRSDQEYEEVAAAAGGRRTLTDEETQELQGLWKKLVRVYHPDRFANDPEKLASYTALTSEINAARDAGDSAILREIATDPASFMAKRGLTALNFGDPDELATLTKLLDALQTEISATLEADEELRQDPKYELHVLASSRPDYLQEVASDISAQLLQEIDELDTQAMALQWEINDLIGDGSHVGIREPSQA